MNPVDPSQEKIKDLNIATLGPGTLTSPFKLAKGLYVNDDQGIMVHAESEETLPYLKKNQSPPMFQTAGPRSRIFFDPSQLTCGIVTCGGLCPGLNDVIRTITLTSLWQYGVKKVLGFRYGYEGLSSKARCGPLELTPANVADIQHEGGTILGSGRGHQEPKDMVDTLVKYNIGILFAIGGDGTFRGAHAVVEEIKKRKLKIAVIGIPKTIDNDIYCSETSFGFGTAVEEARKAVASAHEEGRSAFNGIGLVKLMGRDSGFIAVCASLANSDVNFCLIPEVPFTLRGKKGLLKKLEKRLENRHHAVIVVAEGAGQNMLEKTDQKDASGNVRYGDIGIFLKSAIVEHFKKQGIPISLKYIDPSYMIRSRSSNSQDSIFCLLLGQMAVHAGMAGKTDMFIGYWNHCYTHVPLTAAINERKKIDPEGTLWQTLLTMTSVEPISDDPHCS